MKFVFFIFLAVIGWVTQSAHAQTLHTYAYQPHRIFTVRTGLGIATQIVLQPQEEIKDFGTGFSNAWDIARRDNIIYLKPKEAHADTNMYIRTNKRMYLLDLKVQAKNWKNLAQAKAAGVHYRVAFSYPVELTSSHAPTQPAVHNSAYDYAVGQASNWLIPISAYDDGKFTYLYFNATQFSAGGMPTVYGKKTEHGEEFLLNTLQHHDRITIFGTYDYVVLRHGNSVVALRRGTQ